MTIRLDNARADLDKLIDFTLRHNLQSTGTIPIRLSPTDLGKALGQVPRSGARSFKYRNFEIVATAPDKAAARFCGGKL